MAISSIDHSNPRILNRVLHWGHNLKESFNKLPLTRKVVLAATLTLATAGCVAVVSSSSGREPAPAVTYYPTSTPKPLNTAVPTESPKPTDTQPTPVPTAKRPVVVIAPTQEITGSIGGGENASNIKDAIIPDEIKPLITGVNIAYTINGEGFGASKRDGKSLIVKDPDTEGKIPFVLNANNGDQYLAITPKGVITQANFVNMNAFVVSETVITGKDLMPYTKFLQDISPRKVEATKEVLTNGNYLRKLISDTVKDYPVELTITESGYNIVGADLNYRLIAIDTKGSAQFLMPQKAGLENAEVNKSAFTALRDVFPGIAKVREIYSVRELAGEFGPTLRRGLEAAGWRNVSLNNPNQPQYFKYISQDRTVMVEIDGRVIPTGLRYWINPWRFLYNSEGNPVPSIGETEYFRIVGDRLPAVQSILRIQ